jgi:hypothetical protein
MGTDIENIFSPSTIHYMSFILSTMSFLIMATFGLEGYKQTNKQADKLAQRAETKIPRGGKRVNPIIIFILNVNGAYSSSTPLN